MSKKSLKIFENIFLILDFPIYLIKNCIYIIIISIRNTKIILI